MCGKWRSRVLAAGVLALATLSSVSDAQVQPAPGAATAVRLHGLVEPVRSFAVAAPRLAAGQPGAPSQLVVMRLATSGQVVKQGDLLVEFDRHAQLKSARDRESEYRDFLEQIRKKKAEQRVAKARRDTELLQARNAVRIAELDLLGADLLPAIQAEKNAQALEEARAHLSALRKTQTLKDHVDAADVRTLEIQRDRALNAWRNAQANAQRMQVLAPIDGLVVLKSIWKNGTMAVVQEGEEVRAGIPILDVVDTSAMRVRALVNQADVERLTVGQAARVTLDSYPARTFEARLEHLSPVATTSMMNQRVRSFLALFTIDGSDAHLLPDLAAAIDVVAADPQKAAGQ
jgi:HlyD family secretion protein